jgi:aspartyl-tRNA(Asn)/glutamyl-tRNA(Gln) amidotransferase subunit B
MEKGWERMSGEPELAAIVDKVLAANAKAVDAVKAGNGKPLGFLVGQIMKETQGRADPQLTQRLLKEKIG